MYAKEAFEKLILEFDGDIKLQVFKTFGKIQKPSPWCFEDLKNAALLEAWKKFQKNFDPSKSSPRTFLFMCVKNALYDIMYYSWKKPALTLLSTMCGDDDKETYQIVSKSNNFLNEVKTLFEENIFTKPEQQYIQLIVFPDKELAQKNFENPRRSRINVRNELGIDGNTEYKLRTAIKTKLEKYMKL